MVVDIFVVFLLILIGMAIYAQGIYIKLVQTQETLEKSMVEIKSLEKQRVDEIPNLIKVCENYIKHEREPLDKMLKAQQTFIDATTLDKTARAGLMLTKALNELANISVNYPELKTNSNFNTLLERFENLDEQIKEQVVTYNNIVNHFNDRIKKSPATHIAKIIKYDEKELYRTTEEKTEMETSEISLNRSA